MQLPAYAGSDYEWDAGIAGVLRAAIRPFTIILARARTVWIGHTVTTRRIIRFFENFMGHILMRCD